MVKPKNTFKGIWIPKSIWAVKQLSLQEKVFLVEIVSLQNNSKNACYASNKYFADFFDISQSRVSHIIKCLVNKGFLIRQLTKTQGGTIRYLKLSGVLEIDSPHSLKSPSSTSQPYQSQSGKTSNRIIHKNNSIDTKETRFKNVNPRKDGKFNK